MGDGPRFNGGCGCDYACHLMLLYIVAYHLNRISVRLRGEDHGRVHGAAQPVRRPRTSPDQSLRLAPRFGGNRFHLSPREGRHALRRGKGSSGV